MEKLLTLVSCLNSSVKTCGKANNIFFFDAQMMACYDIMILYEELLKFIQLKNISKYRINYRSWQEARTTKS